MGFGDQRKRPPPSWTVSESHARRRRLKTSIEDVDDDDGVFDAFEEGDGQGWHWLTAADQAARPLPSSQALVSTSAIAHNYKKTGKMPIPLLQDFYQSINKTQSSIEVGEDADGDGEVDVDGDATEADGEKQESDEPLDSIDDPSNSTIAIANHQKYTRLTKSTNGETWTHLQRREFSKLKEQVLAEQQAYRQELFGQFFVDHLDRFRVGFQKGSGRTNDFSNIAIQVCSRQRISIRTLQPGSMPMHFGKCSQIISLQAPGVAQAIQEAHTHAPIKSKAKKKSMAMTPDDLDIQVVHHSVAGVPRVDFSELETENASVPSPAESCIPTLLPLRDDELARELAQTHRANVLTTSETLESIMQLPGVEGSQWMAYLSVQTEENAKTNHLSSSKSIRILDLPLAQNFTSPRQCLVEGFQEGIYQWLNTKVKNNENEKSNEPSTVGYVYALWRLPRTSSSSATPPGRVLIRSTVRCMDAHSSRPLCVRAHLEYFPKRGREAPPSHERALWILDQVARGHDVVARVARVDPVDCAVREWNDASSARAMVGGITDPMVHWQVAMQVLRSLPMIPSSCLLCFPGRDMVGSTPRLMSASVHMPEGKSEHAIDVEAVLEQASGVLLGPSALLRCACEWEWQDEDRVPHTFPVQKQPSKL